MGEKKSSTILLTVIGIATLLVTLVGATFAYFTAEVRDANPDNEDVVITAAKLGEIVFAHGDTVTLANALPGATDTKTFTISAPDSTIPIDYVVYLDTTVNEVGTYTDAQGVLQNRAETNNLVARLSSSNATAKSELVVTDENPNGTPLKIAAFAPDNDTKTKVEIGRGTLAANGSDTWTLTVELVETKNPQNDDQGRSFTGTIVVEAAQYTQDTVYTTTTTNNVQP